MISSESTNFQNTVNNYFNENKHSNLEFQKFLDNNTIRSTFSNEKIYKIGFYSTRTDWILSGEVKRTKAILNNLKESFDDAISGKVSKAIKDFIEFEGEKYNDL